jgi:hypothetical protein
MSLVLQDRVRETTNTTGTGTFTLLGAVTGYQSFSVIGNGNTCFYACADQGGPNWEVGIGTYSSGTLARTTVLSSSNSGSLVNFTAGTKDVFITQPSEEAVYGSGTAIVGPSGASLGVANGGTGLTSLTAGYIPYGNGTSAFSSSANLTFNGSTQLSINTTGGAPTGGLYLTYSGTQVASFTSNAATGEVRIGATNSTGTFYSTFYSNNAEAMRIDSAGNVGIGTTPSYKLDVSGTLRVTGISTLNATNGFIVNSGASTSAKYIDIENTSGSLFAGVSSSAGTGIMSSGRAYSAALAGQAGIQFSGNNGTTVHMDLNSSGYVGIGTSSPSYPLTVNGTTFTTGITISTGGGTNIANTVNIDTDGAGTARYYSHGGNTTTVGSHSWHLVSSNGTVDTIAMSLSTSGYLGIGTSSPASQLHINFNNTNANALTVGNNNNGAIYGCTTSGTPIIGSYVGANSIQFGYFSGGISTTFSEFGRFDSSGNLLVGTTSNASGTPRAYIVAGATDGAWVSNTNAGSSTTVFWNKDTANNNTFSTFATEGTITVRGSISYNRAGGIVLYNTTSDQRLKENIVDAPSALEKINSVKIRSFDWIETKNKVDFGVIAQELELVAPECVSPGEDNPDGTMKTSWSVDTSGLVPAMVKAIQEQQALITTMQTQVAALQAKVGA